jgi:membrane-bound lytic murein transglycosylase D
MPRKRRALIVYVAALLCSTVAGFGVPPLLGRGTAPASAATPLGHSAPAVVGAAASALPVDPTGGAGFEGQESPELRTLRAAVTAEPRVRNPSAADGTPFFPPAHAVDTQWLERLQKPTLAVRPDARVEAMVRYFTEDLNGRKAFSAWLKRRGRYRSIVLASLHERVLPDDLEALAMIESGFSPTAVSTAGATGMWQLMPETARAYGLSVETDHDERRNVRKATDAAVRHLGDLHEKLGSWDLAFAAYDMGYGGVLKRIRDLGTNDYWAMSAIPGALPEEAVAYVPKVLGAAIVLHNLQHFGFAEVAAESALSVAEIDVPPNVPLALVARAAGTSLARIRELNPELLTGSTTSRSRVVTIPAEGRSRAENVLPKLIDSADKLESSVSASFDWGKDELPTPSSRRASADGGDGIPWVFYRVGDHEKIETIAGSFGVSAAMLVADNRLDPDAHLQKGMLLKVRPSAEAIAKLAKKRAETRAPDEDSSTAPSGRRARAARAK